MTLSLPAHQPPPDSDPSSSDDAEWSANGAAPEALFDASDVPERYQETLMHLQTQVQNAARTIERLRTENQALRRKVAALEERPDVPEGHSALIIDDDRESLRRQITDFIDAIDGYLGDSDVEGDNDADGDASDAADSGTDDLPGAENAASEDTVSEDDAAGPHASDDDPSSLDDTGEETFDARSDDLLRGGDG